MSVRCVRKGANRSSFPVTLRQYRSLRTAYREPSPLMASTYSFDVSTGVDLQEVDNAVNQASKEVAQRYDFKGSTAAIEFKRAESMLVLTAEDDFRMTAL